MSFIGNFDEFDLWLGFERFPGGFLDDASVQPTTANTRFVCESAALLIIVVNTPVACNFRDKQIYNVLL